MPLEQIPVIGPALAATLDPPLRVLIEAGYDRTINPGQPTPARWLFVPDLLKTAANFLEAIPTGWDNGIATLTGDPTNRPFHTTAPGPYGVGGPPVDTGAIDPTDRPHRSHRRLPPLRQTRTRRMASAPQPNLHEPRLPRHGSARHMLRPPGHRAQICR